MTKNGSVLSESHSVVMTELDEQGEDLQKEIE